MKHKILFSFLLSMYYINEYTYMHTYISYILLINENVFSGNLLK